jgi:hypothetical protein
MVAPSMSVRLRTDTMSLSRYSSDLKNNCSMAVKGLARPKFSAARLAAIDCDVISEDFGDDLPRVSAAV